MHIDDLMEKHGCTREKAQEVWDAMLPPMSEIEKTKPLNIFADTVVYLMQHVTLDDQLEMM